MPRLTFSNFRKTLLVRGQALDEVLSVPELEESILTVRHQQRPQRCEWEQMGIPLEGIVLPGSDEWLLVLLQEQTIPWRHNSNSRSDG